MKTVRIPCPNCKGAGKVAVYGSETGTALVSCPECKEETTVEVLAPSDETFQPSQPTATMETNTKATIWQVVIAVCTAINSIALAYTAFQSAQNHNQVTEIRQTQEENTAKISDVHRQVETIHKEQLPRMAAMH